MSIFQPCSGGVLKVDECAGSNGNGVDILKIDDAAMTGVPITGFSLQLHTNHQFLHSLDEFIYVFPFGDRIGELTVTGLGFFGGDCDSADLPDADKSHCGIIGYYFSKRLSQIAGFTPTQITIGGCGGNRPLLGFLTGLRMETIRPEMPIIQWVLRYNVIIG